MLLAAVNVAVPGISCDERTYHGYFYCAPGIVEHQMTDFAFRNLIQAGDPGSGESARGFDAPVSCIILENYVEGKAERTRLLASDGCTEIAEGRHVLLLVHRLKAGEVSPHGKDAAAPLVARPCYGVWNTSTFAGVSAIWGTETKNRFHSGTSSPVFAITAVSAFPIRSK